MRKSPPLPTLGRPPERNWGPRIVASVLAACALVALFVLVFHLRRARADGPKTAASTPAVAARTAQRGPSVQPEPDAQRGPSVQPERSAQREVEGSGNPRDGDPPSHSADHDNLRSADPSTPALRASAQGERASTSAEPAPSPTKALAAPAERASRKPHVVSLVLNGALETDIDAKVGERIGPALAQVVRRELVWWVQVPRDLQRGDRLQFVYREVPDEEPEVDAVRFVSHSEDRTFAAYRFHAKGDRWARLYMPNGEELEKRIVHPPLTDYEQVTSLLGDGRHHHGIDFKTPVGTKVIAPFDGTIARTTWHFHANGNCLELDEAAPPHRRAIFLHLSKIAGPLHAGARIHRGQLLAYTGDTGHSFAPHLHYQLMLGRRVLDPFHSQKTYRRKLPASELAAFHRVIARYDAEMGPRVAAD